MSRRKLTFVALAMLCAGLFWNACQSEPPTPQRVGIKAAVPVPPESSDMESGFSDHGEVPQRARTIDQRIDPAQRLAANHAQPNMHAEDEDDESKYWAGVEFGAEQFDEVLEFVAQEYIEEKTDASRAYVSAANFALSSLDPARELLPQSYYDSHKDDPEIELTGDDRDELTLRRREIFRKRHDELQAEWKKIKFGRKEFEAVMAEAQKQGSKSKKKKVTRSRLWLAAAQGYLYALDPHSSLLSTKAWEESTQETHDASFDGIGALLTQRFEPSKTLRNRLDGKTRKLKGAAGCLLMELKEEDKLRRRTFVESPMPGQPAERAGVWAGDEIVKVDGTSVVDMPLDKVVSMIRGKRDTAVKLTLLREGVPGETVVSVTRAHIRVTNVEGRLLENHPCVGYVKLTGFIETSYNDLETRIAELESECSDGEGLRGLVFDLRNNSGGLLSQGVMISDLFVPKGIIVTVKNRRKSVLGFMSGPEMHQAHKKGTLTLPLVVLVNDGAASASEIVASALQDNGRGLIVGERTFGKASVQTLISPLRGKGYYIKLTIARYFSPSGRTLQVVGVTPDVTAAPGVDGKMPVGFREEDLSNHLPQLDTDYESTNKQLTVKLKSCVEKRGIAERIFKDNPHPQIKFDYQLYLGADYLECLIEHGRKEEVDIVDLEIESP
jgi:C-terminal peptidase prc